VAFLLVLACFAGVVFSDSETVSPTVVVGGLVRFAWLLVEDKVLQGRDV
jgi:hypothetical protein